MADGPLAAVADWKLEEKGQDNLRYFFSFDEVNRVESGRNCFVIGRKGSGKTAGGGEREGESRAAQK